MTQDNSVPPDGSWPRKFAILLASRAIGGEERFVAELAIAMQRTTTCPTILNLKSPMPYAGDLEAHGVEIRAGIANERHNIAGLLRLIRMLRQIRPDVLLINSNRQAMVFAALATRCCRIPVTLVHTHESQGRSAALMRLMARTCDGVVAAAESHCTYLSSALRVPPSRVTRVYPGINLDRAAGGAAGALSDLPPHVGPTIGIVAALRPEKDHETFLKAAALVAARIPETRFLVIGDGPRRPHLEGLARDYGIGAQVRFLGWQPVDLHSLRRLDILVLSSVNETFPAVILEAFSAGVPVVATGVGSVPELFGDPPCGVLVAPRDPGALALALVSLAQDRAAAQRLAAAALLRAGYFSADRFCRDMLLLTRRVAVAKVGDPSPDIARLADSDPAEPRSTLADAE